MVVRLSTSLIWHGRVYCDGDEIELPDDVAKRYIATRQAEVVTHMPLETAALRTIPAKGKRDVRTAATR